MVIPSKAWYGSNAAALGIQVGELLPCPNPVAGPARGGWLDLRSGGPHPYRFGSGWRGYPEELLGSGRG